MGHLLPLPTPSDDHGAGRHERGETGEASEPEPLWREVTGELLRERRHERGEKLSETAGRAGISTQYLSEVERGRKDPSSEVLSAVAGALDLTLRDLAVAAARRLYAVPDAPLRAPEPVRSPEPMWQSVGPMRGPLALAA